MDDTYQPTPFYESRRKSPNSKKRLIISTIVVLLLIVLGIFGIQMMTAQKSEDVISAPTPTSIVFPTDTPTPSVEPTPETSPTPTKKAAKSSIDSASGLDRSTLGVAIQNGSGQAGVANSGATTLKDLGYKVISTGNADNFDYIDVIIQVKSDKAKFLDLLKKDLSSSYTVGKTASDLSASSSADAVVIIGK